MDEKSGEMHGPIHTPSHGVLKAFSSDGARFLSRSHSEGVTTKHAKYTKVRTGENAIPCLKSTHHWVNKKTACLLTSGPNFACFAVTPDCMIPAQYWPQYSFPRRIKPGQAPTHERKNSGDHELALVLSNAPAMLYFFPWRE
jgi:hypothetical protein